ncbi:hypothetical protein RAS12_30185 (plasmid) [Achromobacter seleniivolatilans]|uniref:Uncharacterized protein n=1 Tax=Achromobacter seleniivolatilans TaxID=3047478 RepID=A0ABY9MA82_9BURK|nr:hypothetical protein [Achromobacter sp. R39]WMD23903.1 hypothetical protein RAS12_30185 [Achromobacter sp. R39]
MNATHDLVMQMARDAGISETEAIARLLESAHAAHDEASLIALSALMAQMIELYAPLTAAELELVAELTAAPYEASTSQAACGAAAGF